MTSNRPTILFDGFCNLCNGAVNFVIDRDMRQQFCFASLQSEVGKRLLAQHQLPEAYLRSLVLIERQKAYIKSAAALRIARRLGGLWPLCYVFIVFPPAIRDYLYTIVAKNRYRWFGKSEACRYPTEAERARFLV